MTKRIVAGIDVSEYQGLIRWERVHATGVEFAYVRASDGRSYVDKHFAEYRAGCGGEGVRWGAYHLFRPNLSIAEQVEHFLSVVGDDIGDLPPCLDLEIAPLAGVDVGAVALEWLRAVEERTGQKPGVYLPPWYAYAQHFEKTPALADYDLWVAEWLKYRDAPTVPQPWSSAGKTWRMWQHWNQGRVDGITGDVDLDWMICDDAADADPEVVTPSPYPMPRPIPKEPA